MPFAQFGLSISGGGVTIQGSVIRETDSVSGLDPALPAGKAGTLTGRTDNDTGIATLSTGHGIISSDKVDVYWDGGRRYNMTATVATNAVTIDGGSGDNLPTNSPPTAVVVVKRVRVNVAIDGDELSLLAVQLSIAAPNSTAKGQIAFYDDGDALIAHLDLTANVAIPYDIEGGISNDFTGNPITYAMASNGDSSNDATLKIIVAQDSTP